MSDEQNTPKTERTPEPAPAATPSVQPEIALKATDSTPGILPGDAVFTRPIHTATPSAIIDPDNRERQALRDSAVRPSAPARPVKVGVDNAFTRKLGLTPGERKFNLLDWFGIGYGVNSVLSIYLADRAKHSGWQPFFSKLYTDSANLTQRMRGKDKFTPEDVFHADKFYSEVNKFALSPENQELFGKEIHKIDPFMESGKFFDAVTKDEALKTRLFSHLEQNPALSKTLSHFGHDGKNMDAAFNAARTMTTQLQKTRGWAKFVVNFVMLGTGGWVMMAPIKWIEDRKYSLIKHYDDRYIKNHTLSQEQVDAIAARHEELKKEAPQTWGSVLAARALAYPIIVAAYVATGAKKNIFRPVTGYTGSEDIAGRLTTRTIGGDHFLDGRPIQGVLQRTGPTQRMLDKAAEKLSVTPAGWKQTFAESPEFEKANFNQIKGKDRLRSIVHDTYVESIYSMVMAAMTFGWSRVTSMFFANRAAERVEREAVASGNMPSQAPEAAASYAAPVPEAPAMTAGNPETSVSAGIHEGLAEKTAERAPRHAEPTASYRDLATQNQVSGGEPARA